MLNKYLKQTTFSSQEDFMENYKVNVPENFNFGYDIVDGWAEREPEKVAMTWVSSEGEHIDFTFADIFNFFSISSPATSLIKPLHFKSS